MIKERIALGFGNNIDYEIAWDSAVLEGLVAQYAIRLDELDIHRAIMDERDLVISVLSFLKLGIGGERFITSPGVIDEFAQKFAKKITLGGTNVRAAIAMRKFGITSALHLVTLNDDVRRLLPPDCPYVCSGADETSYPHLIVQFGKDTRVRSGDIDLCAPHANRLIYHSDWDNIQMALNEDFADMIGEAGVLLAAGFNAMQDERLLVDRLEMVLRMMRSLPSDALVFTEDAGYYNPKFKQIVRDALLPKLSVFSLNEDELQDYLNVKLDLLDVAQVVGALKALHIIIPVPALVVHSKHWAIAYGEGARRLSSALKAGVTMATTRYCFGDDFTLEQHAAIGALPPLEEAAQFAESMNKGAGDTLFCVPVPRFAPATATSVGLGDAFVGGFLPTLLRIG
jgi:ADP-dependent phosphofructokinase/glucokinase